MSEKKTEPTAPREFYAVISSAVLPHNRRHLLLDKEQAQEYQEEYDGKFGPPRNAVVLREVTQAPETAPREFWLDIATPYGDPCDFISEGKPHEHPSATNIHVREVTQAAQPVKVQRYDFNYDGAAGEEDTGRFVLYEDIKHLLGEES